MKKMTRTHAVAALLLAAVTSSVAAFQNAATAGSSTQVKRLAVHETAFHELGERGFAGTDRARSRATGKVVGFDTFTGHVGRHDRLVLDAAFAFKGGLILARIHSTGKAPPTWSGRVTGGTGAYEGATGTVSGRGTGQKDTNLTIRYTL